MQWARTCGFGVILLCFLGCTALPKPNLPPSLPSLFKSEPAPEPPPIRTSEFQKITGHQPLACSAPEFYDDGPKIRQKMLDLIESANDYILIDSFLATYDEDSKAVFAALKRKHDAGVRVYLLTDTCSRYIAKDITVFDWLDKAGIPNAEYNPQRIHKWLVAPVLLKRDHRKFWIVDGKTLLLGGANLTSTSLRDPSNGGNLDYMLSIQSGGAAEKMVSSFITTWNKCGAGKLKKKDFFIDHDHQTNTVTFLTDQNRDKWGCDKVSRMFKGLYAQAEKEVWLVQPYTFTTPVMLSQFRELRDRGVSVNIMLPGDVHSNRFHYASYYGIKDLVEAGVSVWALKPGHGHLHAKMIVIDDHWVSIGSTNLNTRSHQFSSEANLTFADHTSLKKAKQSLDELKKRCRRISPEEAKKYRGSSYLTVWLWMQLMG